MGRNQGEIEVFKMYELVFVDEKTTKSVTFSVFGWISLIRHQKLAIQKWSNSILVADFHQNYDFLKVSQRSSHARAREVIFREVSFRKVSRKKSQGAELS